jgi:hypothetical protein
MTYEDMFKSERFKKISERAEYTAGEDAVEIVSIIQELMPEIEKCMKRQFKLYLEGDKTLNYSISLKDLEDKVDERHNDHLGNAKTEKDLFDKIYVSMEALFCIISSVAWHHNRIVTDINTRDNHCIGLWFRFGSGDDEEPSVESCTREWMLLYQEA